MIQEVAVEAGEIILQIREDLIHPVRWQNRSGRKKKVN